jgi:hypothetical protein
MAYWWNWWPSLYRIINPTYRPYQQNKQPPLYSVMIINPTYRPYQQNKQSPLYTVMIINSTYRRIDDHHSIERWLFVLLIWHIGRIDDHHCIERWLFVLLIWPIGRIPLYTVMVINSTYRPYQQNKQPPLYSVMIINSTYRPYQQNKRWSSLYREVVVCFVDMAYMKNDDHHCIERWLFVLLIWPIGRIDDQPPLYTVMVINSTYWPYQQNKQPPLYTVMIISCLFCWYGL